MSVRALLSRRQPPPEPVIIIRPPAGDEPGADPLVFGEPYRPLRETTPATWRSRTCWLCGARWHSESRETPCWACGAVMEEPC